MSGTQSERCPRCGGTTGSSAAGSLTQWMVVCSCKTLDAEPSEQEITRVRLCRKCGKRINLGRSGSLTQWVFRQDYCDCEEPDAIDGTLEQLDSADAESPPAIDSFEALEELAIEASKFPKERYKAVSIIGKGGSGVVYYCVDKLLDKVVAVKTLHSMTPAQLVSFQNEARATSRLNHPAIIKVFDFGATEGGVPFMAMEYFEGVSLSRIIQERDHLPLAEVAEIFYQICTGLSSAHAAGIMHRDVKSSNLLIRSDETGAPEVRIIDFGVAVNQASDREELAKGHTMVGTPGYMAPDQAAGEIYDERSEIYGLGCSIFEALTGSIPFEGAGPLDIMRRRAQEDAPSLSETRPDLEFSEDIEAIVAQCLARNKADRYQSMGELAEDLDCLRPREPAIEEADEQPRPSMYRAGSYALATVFVVSAVVLALNTGLGVVKETQKLTAPLAPIKIDTVNEPVAFPAWDEQMRAHFELRNRHHKRFLCSKGEVGNEDLKQLKDLTPFTRLSLLGSKIDDRGLQYLTALPLEAIEFNGTKISDRAIEVLSSMKSLVWIDVSGTRVSDRGLASVKQWNRLTHLGIGGKNASDASLELISGIDTLEGVYVTSPKRISARGINCLQRLKKLSDLEISYVDLDSAAVKAIGRLKTVRELQLDRVGLDNEKLASLAGLDLVELKARHNRLSSPALGTLALMAHLEKVNLIGNRPMSPATMEELRRILPDCEFIFKQRQEDYRLGIAD